MKKIRMTDKLALRRVRLEKLELERMQDDYKERCAAATMRCKPFDGMPHSPNTGGGLDGCIGQLDGLSEAIKRQEKRCVNAERAARQALVRMMPSPVMYAFLLRFYVEAMEIKQACKECGVCLRQGYKYREMIENQE